MGAGGSGLWTIGGGPLDRSGVTANLRMGVAWGLKIAFIVSALAAFGWLLDGGAALRAVGMRGIVHTVSTYLLAGTLGGLIVGILWPLRIQLIGAWLLGVATGFVVYLVIAWSRAPDRPILVTLGKAATGAVVTGTIVSMWFWFSARHKP